ncbi:VWFA domain-containing protein [Caenorhabditis elegans]|uniref:VWFA domain-containing protein n=1 Tax=Caenorhabditis elegans TaxID=6239 RepID=H2KZC8_CAEEL|nr:VWFA domain-containing protein [Caenorhabditis elegans]CCD67654.1 VWFA domain-containing protein [Caenorhabditis elegans]|eukprot:NP_001294212.1 human DICE1 (Deleted In Cancer) homolog [Caenorhabditis elegans]
MPCFFFILDTSGSMSTRAHPQFSFFDLAKNFIENFIKQRTKGDNRMMVGRETDKYFLMTTQARYPKNVKVACEKLGAVVIEEIKKLHLPYGSCQLHHAILEAFKVLHVSRVQTGIDGVGIGRLISNTEPVTMILLTDGSGVAGIPIDFRLFFDPPFLGSEMTRDAFRWDQKFYTVVFRIPSTPYRPTISQLTAIDIDMPVIERLCARTGGRSFSIVSPRQIQTTIDYLLAMGNQYKIGVRFECLPAIPAPITSDEVNLVKMKFKKVIDKRPVTNIISRLNPQARPVTCHWPIPESFFPMRTMDQLPQRTSHPVILCAPIALPLHIRPELPVDKLELEPGGISDIIMEILQGRKDMTVWTYMEGSSNGPTAPFGCLRMNTLGTGITLILMPFNFPMLYSLVEEIVKEPFLNKSQVWRSKLESYFHTVPFYYNTQIRVCLDKFDVKVDYSSSMSMFYPGQLLSNLNRFKAKAREELDQMAIASKLNDSKTLKIVNPSIRIERITSRSTIIGLGNSEVDIEDDSLEGYESTPIYAGDFKIPLYPPSITDAQLDSAYRTPYSSPIEDLTSKLNRIQANIELMFDPNKITLLDMAKLGTKARFNTLEELHNMPQKLMGEYEPYQAARVKYYGQPMRKIDEEKDRTHAFGNPYKLKGLGAGIDEVMDSAVVDNNSPSTSGQPKRFGGEGRQGGGPPKRRRGPLGIDAYDQYRIRRSMRGSSAGSDISDISSSLGTFDQDSDMTTPGTSGMNTPISEFDDLQLQEMDSDDQLMKNLDEVQALRKKEEAQVQPKIKKPPPVPPASILSSQEILTRKIRIGSIIRKPANHCAFEEIMTLVAGITQEACSQLIKYALRESQRFKLKQLTERLENRLKTV